MDSLNTKIKFLQEALTEEPENISLRFQLASAYFQSKDSEKAIKQCELVLKIDPDNKDAITLLEHCKSAGTSKSLAKKEKLDDLKETSNEDKPMPDESIKKYFEKAKTTFQDVGGMKDLKEEIRMGIIYPFEKPELFEKYGKKTGGGLLLYGPPGCGKTYIARATAGEIKAQFLSISIHDVLDMWLGESERKLHQLFQTAREVKPTVLFFDEVDALGIDRMKASGAASSLVNQLLLEMDGAESDNDKVMIIGATNTPWNIDSAFHRPGRFDKIIFIPPPDESARAEIFKIYLDAKPKAEIDYIELAKKTKFFSGADISKVVDLAVESVMREVMSGKPERDITMDDILNAIKNTSASTREWFATAKNFARYANESGTYTPILNYMKENGI